jgi:hypothetical protein
VLRSQFMSGERANEVSGKLSRPMKVAGLVAGCALFGFVVVRSVTSPPHVAVNASLPSSRSERASGRAVQDAPNPGDEVLDRISRVSLGVADAEPAELEDRAFAPGAQSTPKHGEPSISQGSTEIIPIDQPQTVYPTTPEQREFVASSLFAPLTSELPAICYGDLRDRAIAKLPKSLAAEDSVQAMALVERLAAAELGYRLELNQAIQDYIRSGHELEKDPAPELLKQGRGHAGDATFGVADPVLWGGARVLKVKYFIDYDSRPRLKAAREVLTVAKKEFRELLRKHGVPR